MDRLESIKRIFEEADASGQISADSPLRWLIAEVERLREVIRSMPIDEMKTCAAYAAQSRHPGIVVDAKTITNWVHGLTDDCCDPKRGYHSTPHKGCILR